MYQKNSLIEIKQLSRKNIDYLIDLAQQAKKNQLRHTLTGKIIATCFFEPSTRTRLSFESAIHRLGASVIGFSDSQNTSIQKGETLEDTMRTISSYADAIVMRHPESGSIKHVATFSTIPVINAGDGSNEHPTQTLLDLYTIKEKFNCIDGLSIALVGDLKYGRTVHSLCNALTNYQNIKIYFVKSESLKLPDEVCQDLQEKGVQLFFCDKLEDLLAQVDVVYMTRLQKERVKGKVSLFCQPRLTLALLDQFANKDLIVMHPLPRIDEIEKKIDQTQYAWYFKQAQNGVFMRQAILHHLFR